MNKEKENNYISTGGAKTMQGKYNTSSVWGGDSLSSSGSNSKSHSTSNLPPLKETNKFSSWADKRDLFDQVDELMMFEQ